MKKQFGGTMLGVVIGAVAGLLVALLVAVYVTKVPVPFMNNKNAGNIADRDASEAKKNKDWDPNGPLASKSAVRPPPPAETPSLAGQAGAGNPVALPPLDARPAERTPAPSVASVDPRTRGSADPLGDLARARAGNDGADPFAYFVQAGAFRGASEAEAQRAKLAIMGWEAQVSEREQAGRTMYRVRLGPFGRKDDADRAKEKLDDAGLTTALVRVQR
ncbi:MAG: SPOR domain-containing protein [Burkholderiales bacterium]